MSEIRVVCVGVGNCASSLIQGVTAAKVTSGDPLVAVANPKIGPYGVGDTSFVGALDIDARKVGMDLGKAILQPPNCTTTYVDVEPLGVVVSAGPRLDGLAQHLSSVVHTDAQLPADDAMTVVADLLRDARADVVVNYLPGGSIRATRFYAEAALSAGAAFVNCNPDPAVFDEDLAMQFSTEGIPLLGDDIKSQFGTTAAHRALLEACTSRGIRVDRSYQIAVGGNTDFLNMRDRERFKSKLRTKTASVGEMTSSSSEIAMVPPEYLGFLADRKVAYIRLEGTGFLGMSLDVEMRISVEDSPNSAGVAIDAIRAAKLAKDRGLGGPIAAACGPLFKCPPRPTSESEGWAAFREFVDGE